VKRERIVVFLLCAAVAVRVFVYSAAFPFFAVTDELSHFDVVYKYSQGQVPQKAVEAFSREPTELIILYQTLEYLFKPGPDGRFAAPGWTIPNVRRSPQFNWLVSQAQNEENHEAGSFPVYYAIAGLWCAIGKLAGIQGGYLLYWVRFLNILVFALLVWFSYLFVKRLFPNNTYLHIALPLVVAVFPQHVFYTINSDILSPLVCALAFFMLLQVYFEDKSYRYHFLAGLAIAAAFLTKVSNINVPVLVAVVSVMKILRREEDKKHLGRLVVLWSAAAIPVGLWLARNYFIFGDLTASAEKAGSLGWTRKPLAEIWNHPIFSPRGLAYFMAELTRRFWRGEFTWHLEEMRIYGMDVFYVASTAIFVLASGIGLVSGRDKADERYRFTLCMSFAAVVVSVLFLAVLSTLYDFGDCFNPSRGRPYFVSGRLISGVLVPFLLIYLDGLQRIWSMLTRRRIGPIVLVTLIAIVIVCSEIVVTAKVFTSDYNWFHLR